MSIRHILHGVRLRTHDSIMAQSGLKAPAPLMLEGNLAQNWKTWINAYEIYAGATGASSKSEKVQCFHFLHVAGADAQKLYHTLDIADKDKIHSLTEAFREYCAGKANITVVRYQFNTYQQTTESMESYIRELRQRIAYCSYSNMEDDLLCDRLVCGVKDDTLRDKLLQTPNLTLQQCLQTCRMSEHNTRSLRSTTECFSESHIDEINRDGRTKTRFGSTATSWKKKNATTWPSAPHLECQQCGYKHHKGTCPAKGKQCAYCSKIGHFAKVCRARRTTTAPVNEICMDKNNIPNGWIVTDDDDEEDDTDLFVGAMSEDDSDNINLWYKYVKVGDQNIRFKLDTGSEANLIPKQTFNKLRGAILRPAKCHLITYTGERIQPEGEAFVDINNHKLRFQITDAGSPILGKDACVTLKLITRIDAINTKADWTTMEYAKKLVNNYENVFNGLGTIKVNATIHVDPNVTPVIDPPRRIPHAIEQDVKKELDRMLKLGVIVYQDEPTPWVNSITIVKKPNKIRVCLDPTKLNKAILRGPYPIKTVEEVVAKTCGAKYFSVLDANSGYWQIKLDEASSLLCTFNTPWGRFRYTRLPFGIKTAGDIFIQEINSILRDIKGVDVVADDILVYGSTIEEHNHRLEAVLKRANEVDLRLNPQKSQICKTEVPYVGHLLTQNGLKPNPERVQAILELVTPTDKQAVQRFLGMIGYIGKFIPNLSEIAKPLRLLLSKEIAWHWNEEQEVAFKRLKELLTKAPVLKYFDVNKPITIQVDASKSGLGAALFQDNHPISLASKALDKTQQNYAVIEKELLAICFGCKKFHEYIFGKEVTIETDHKPLVSIMIKPLHMLTARVQRMRMRLQNYNLRVIYLKGSQMYFADTLSRAHTNKITPNNLFDKDISIAAIEYVEEDLAQIEKETEKDHTLQELIRLTREGWPQTPSNLREDIKPYAMYKDEFSIENKILLKGDRITIPASLQQEMIDKIHESHLGIVKSKQLARDFMFWPGLGKQVEDKVSRCQTCQSFRNIPNNEPLISHNITDIPYHKVGIDLFEYKHEHYLIIVDYYSKYPEIARLKSTTSEAVIERMKEIFCRHGIPKIVMSDNGPQFTSQEYKIFSDRYNFTRMYSSPMYPCSNGQAERSVQTIKQLIKKTRADNKDINIALLAYRNTKLYGVGSSPAQLLMSRVLRSKIPTTAAHLKPAVVQSKLPQMKIRQQKQKYYHDKTAGKTHKALHKGDRIKYLTHEHKWADGHISQPNLRTHRDYQITTDENKSLRRNRIHIFKTNVTMQNKTKQQNPKPTSIKSNDNTGRIQNPSQPHGKYITRYGRVIKPINRLQY